MWYRVNVFVYHGLGHTSLCTCLGYYLFLHAKEWEPHMGSCLVGFSHALGMCLALYILQLILWEMSGTVWV